MGTNFVNWRVLKTRTRWLLPPNLTSEQKKIVTRLRQTLMKKKYQPRRNSERENLIWLLSSGTQSSGEVKAVGLTVAALENSAQSVNEYLRVTAHDRWLLALPTYHVGGLGILVRAELSHSKVFQFTGKWDARRFARTAHERGITLTSLVPTQVFDLVQAQLRAPNSLRAVVVGGGSLDKKLATAARALGWPIFFSYGLTECGSQVATGRRDLVILPHVRIRFGAKKKGVGRIEIQSPSLCRWIARGQKTGRVEIKKVGASSWFKTEDLGQWYRGNKSIVVVGRDDDVVKILGELVSIPQVEAKVRRHTGHGVIVLPVPDLRRGHKLIAVGDLQSANKLENLKMKITRHNSRAPGIEKIARVYWLRQLPLSPLGKVKRREVQVTLGLSRFRSNSRSSSR